MANFFKYFPKTLYFDSTGNNVLLATNLLSRLKFLDNLKNNTSSYFFYDIKTDSETPEILADRFYGSVERHWIILLFNNIIDPQYDWYLSPFQFDLYIQKKYEEFGGISYAQSAVYSYQIKETKTVTSPQEQFSEISYRTVDKSTYDSFIEEDPVPVKSITLGEYSVSYKTEKIENKIYDHEFSLNEEKRRIKILNKNFISDVETEMRSLMKSFPKPSI